MESLNPALFKHLPQEGPIEDNAAACMSFVVAYLRAVESEKEDRIINDPFAEPLVRKEKAKIEKFMAEMQEVHSHPENLIALRTRYLDDRLNHRNAQILQVVNLGAGLDARAYRLESLQGCHVLEIDQSGAMFEHKAEVMKELHAPLVAKKVDCIVSDLSEAGLEGHLVGRGFDPKMPTFWIMEGLLPFMERASIVDLLKVIDYMSAPGSEFWADISNQVMADSVEWGSGRRMKYGEDDPAHGVLAEIPWNVEVQASVQNPGTHFGREWTPMLTKTTKTMVPCFFVVGKKPVPAVVVEQTMVPGLEFEE